MQPQNRSVYGLFKNNFNAAANEWHLNNLGKAMNIYDLPVLVAISYKNATTLSNILSGFLSTEIFFLTSKYSPTQIICQDI